MNKRRSIALLGLGAVGLAGLVGAAFFGGGSGLGELSDEHLVNQSAKFYVKKYAISPEDARRFVTSPQRKKIEREIEEWRAQYGYPENNSPLVRGFVRDRVRALAGPPINMLRVIVSESRSPQEYARRAEAWASTEAKPPAVSTIVAAYRQKHSRVSPAQLERLVRQARAARLSQARSRWHGYMRQAEEHEDLID